MATDKLLKLSQVSIIKEDSDNSYLGKTAQAASAAKLGNTEAVGSATQPVYFSADGVPVAGTYTLGKSVPADAVFTDTTYSDVTADGASGLMTGADKTKLNGVTAGAKPNVIESVTVGGSPVTVTGKAVALGSAAGASTEATLTDGSNLPTGAAVKTFVENKGYQTASQVTSAINAALSSVLDFKGVKATKAELPTTGNKVGDVWHVTADTSEYVWDGSAWEEMGVTFNASGYVQTSDLVYATDDDVRAALGQSA